MTTTTPPPAPAIGDAFDGYTVSAILSEAPGRVVFAANDPALARDVVIKLVHAAEDRRQMAKEARLMQAIADPGVAPVLRFAELDAGAYLVIDQAVGITLEQMLRQPDPMSGETVIELLIRLSQAVEAVHAAGYLHRDLKPANIVIHADGRPTLIDFGAAATATDAAAQSETDLTPGYAAPEQYQRGGNEGPWTDVYALAAIGYRAVAGAPPPDARQRLAEDTLIPASQAATNPGLAPALLQAIDRALRLPPAARPQSVEAWRDTLPRPERARRLAGKTPVDPAPVAPTPVTPTPVTNDEAPTVRVERLPHLRPISPPAGNQPAPAQRSRFRLGQAFGYILAAAILIVGLVWTRPLPSPAPMTDWLVDPSGLGDAMTIGEAMRSAPDGATIRVQPGEYRETLLLDRPLFVIGQGNGDATVIVRPDAGPCAIGEASYGLVRGLTFTGTADNGHGPCIVLGGGGLVIENNRIVDRGGPAIVVRAGARPFILNNRISAIDGPGITVEGGAAGLLIGNEISDTTGAGIVVQDGAVPTINRNTISGAGQAGVLFQGGSAGLMLDNDIVESRASGVEIREGARPTIAGNRIQAGRQAGIYAYASAAGYIKDNAITDNAFSGIIVDAASPLLQGNIVQDNAEHGILIMNDSTSRLVRNSVLDNGGHGLAIGLNADPTLDANQVSGNADPQTQYGMAPGG